MFRFLIIVWFCLCTATAFGADFTFDAANLSHSFDGFGAQIWPGDSRVESLTNNLNLKYYRIAPGGCTSPPNDVTTAVMDAYVNTQYNGTNRGNSVEYSLGLAETLGVKVIFIKFGGVPSTWLSDSTYRELKSEYFNDFARIWASEILYFKNRGYTIDYTELFNEPEGNWNIKVSPSNYNTVVKLVRAELDSRGLTNVGIIGPGLAYLYYGTSWIGGLDTAGKNAIAAWSTHAWDEGWGNTSALPSFLDQRWQDYFGAAVESADPTGSKPIIVTEYATAVRTYNGVTFDSDEYCDSNQFAQRCYENSLTMANNGANVLCYWEAANQSWQDNFYGWQRVNSTYRPVYYSFLTLAPYIPDNAMVLTKTWNDSQISAAGFLGSGKLVLAFANSTANTVTRSISVQGVTTLNITAIKAFQNGLIIDKTSLYDYDFAAGNMVIELPAESTLTIAADVSACGAGEIGDLNNDCKVTFADFTKVAFDWMADNRITQTEVLLDDFESYTSSTALNAAWAVHTGGNTMTETLVNESGNNVMRMDYEVESPYWTQTKFTLPGAINGSSGINWANLGYTSLSFRYKITDVGSGIIYFTGFDCWSQKILSASWPSTSVTNGWVDATIDFSTALQAGMNLENVCVIAFGANSTWYSSPTGNLFIDDVVLNGAAVEECSQAINGDVNGDCVVDYDDLKIICNNWLECTLLEQSECW